MARRRRPPRSIVLRRWAAVAALALVALLYVHPLRAYLGTRSSLETRRAQVHALEAQKRTLVRRLAASSSAAALEREARQLGYVAPGEHLYIVKGIEAWRHRLAASVKGRG